MSDGAGQVNNPGFDLWLIPLLLVLVPVAPYALVVLWEWLHDPLAATAFVVLLFIGFAFCVNRV